MNQAEIWGIVYALSACFIWGSIFVIPQLLMSGFSTIEISLGRYFLYGIASFILFFRARYQGLCKYPATFWKKALLFSLISTTGYYTFVVLALRYSTPAICALILGISPITIAFYGNYRQKEIAFRNLLLPSFLILAGLLIINVPHLEKSSSPPLFLLGLACSFLALSSWSWFAVANARFLKQNRELYSSDWSTLLGVTTFFWAIIFGFLLSLGQHIRTTLPLDDTFIKFVIGCVILGWICSWIGAYLWNLASLSLPVSLAGQLTIFETIFGLLFVYSMEGKPPTFSEAIGIVLLLFAVFIGVRMFSKKKIYNQELYPH